MPTSQPSPQPTLFLPRKGYPIVPSKAAPFAPKPPVAPRGTTEESDNRAQSLALELWSQDVEKALRRTQTSIIHQQPATSSAGTTTSATYTATLTGSSANSGPLYPDSTLGDEAMKLTTRFALTITLTANIANGAMSFQVLNAITGAVAQSAGDNFALVNPGTNIGFRASATYNFVPTVAGSYIVQTMYRAPFGGTATFDLRQIFLSGVGH